MHKTNNTTRFSYKIQLGWWIYGARYAPFITNMIIIIFFFCTVSATHSISINIFTLILMNMHAQPSDGSAIFVKLLLFLANCEKLFGAMNEKREFSTKIIVWNWINRKNEWGKKTYFGSCSNFHLNTPKQIKLKNTCVCVYLGTHCIIYILMYGIYCCFSRKQSGMIGTNASQ